MRSVFVIVNAINRMTPIILEQLSHHWRYCSTVDYLDHLCYAITHKIMIQGSKVFQRCDLVIQGYDIQNKQKSFLLYKDNCLELAKYTLKTVDIE